jgi:hypothetical protein
VCVTISSLSAISAGELPVAPPPRPADPPEVKREKATLGCRAIAQAIEAYQIAPANKTSAPPAKLYDLVVPPFGGQSFLKKGAADLIDPWGNPYQMTPAKHPDGTQYVLITTETPEALPISQFGIGAKAKPPAK